jgi:hypothetical protein
VAGSLVQLNSQFSILYASRVAQDKSIYAGSLGCPYFCSVLPFVDDRSSRHSVAYAFQNRRAYTKERQAEQMSQRGRERLAFRLMTCIGLRFQTGDTPARQRGRGFGVSLRLVGQILTILCRANLVTEVAGPENAYVRPGLGQITATTSRSHAEWLKAEMPTRPDSVQDELVRIEQAECDAASAITVQEMVARLVPPSVPREDHSAP